MNTNTLLIILIVVLIGLGGAYFLFGKKEDKEPLQTLGDRYNLGSFGDGEPQKGWGDFAQGIKNYVKDPDGATDPNEIYSKNVDGVRGFLKLNDIEVTGWAVKTLKNQINDYLKNDNRPYYEI